MPLFLVLALLWYILDLWFFALGWAIGAVGFVLFIVVGLLISPFVHGKRKDPEPDPDPADDVQERLEAILAEASGEAPSRWPVPKAEPIGDGSYTPSDSLAPRFSSGGWPVEVYQRPRGYLVVVDPDGRFGTPFAYGFGPDGKPDDSMRVVPVWHPSRDMRKAVPTEHPLLDCRPMGKAFANAVQILDSEGLGDAPKPKGARSIRY